MVRMSFGALLDRGALHAQTIRRDDLSAQLIDDPRLVAAFRPMLCAGFVEVCNKSIVRYWLWHLPRFREIVYILSPDDTP